MAQYSRPNADLETNGWTSQVGLASNLWDTVNETAADDADFARVGNPDGQTLKLSLSSVFDPVQSTGHIVRYRLGKSGAGSIGMVVALVQSGSTTIASWAHPVVTSLTTYEQTLSAGEANAITDYTDLELWVTADTGAEQHLLLAMIWNA